MSAMKGGTIAAVVGTVAIFVGLFGLLGRCAVPGAPCPSPSPNEIVAYGGLAALIIGVALLLRAGWRGTFGGWAVAAVTSVPATWFVYELVRQEGCPQLADPEAADACIGGFGFGLGEMTAPTISMAVAGVILVLGLFRWRSRRTLT